MLPCDENVLDKEMSTADRCILDEFPYIRTAKSGAVFQLLACGQEQWHGSICLVSQHACLVYPSGVSLRLIQPESVYSCWEP